MKNLPVIALLLMLGHVATAQIFHFGLKGGINTQVNKPADIIIGSGDSTLNLGIDKFRFGTQFGAYVRLGNKVFIQPELLFNSTKTDYRFKESSFSEVVKNRKYQHLDMPILVGFKMGPIRFNAGPVGHYFLNSNSELTDINGYKERFKQFTWSWLAGITIGTGRISADLRYEGNFNNEEDQFTFFGENYNFSKTPSRFILGVNIAIIK